jgi:CHASE2 domain-containing sensor protein
VLKCLQKERSRRYQTAGEVAGDVHRYLEGRPILAKRDSVAYVAMSNLRRDVARHPLAACVLVLIATTALGLMLERTGWLIRHADRRVESLIQWLRQSGTPVWNDDVVVVGLDDASFSRIGDLAAAAGVEGVSPTNLYSLRRLHGALMRRLAMAEPRVVAWDIAFDSSQPEYDSAFLEGIEALHGAGARVVVAVSAVDENNRPVMSPAISEMIDGWGWLHLHRASGRVRGPLLAVDSPPWQPTPSLALAAFAAGRHPGLRPHYVLSRERSGSLVGGAASAVSVWYANPEGSAESPEWKAANDLFTASYHDEQYRVGASPGSEVRDRTALAMLTIVPASGVLASHTVSYADVFAFESATLREVFHDKTVLIGSMRTAEPYPDRMPVDDGLSGRDEFGCYVHATAIAQLLNRAGLDHAGYFPLTVLFALTALFGVILAGVCSGQWGSGWWWAGTGAATLIILGIVWASAVWSRILISAPILLVVYWVAAVFGRAIALAARRRRMRLSAGSTVGSGSGPTLVLDTAHEA